MKKQNKNLNIYFILADENMFHPHYLKGVLRSLDEHYTVVGMTIAKAKYSKGFIHFLKMMIQLWGPLGFIGMSCITVARSVIDRFLPNKQLTLHSVAANYNIPYRESFNVNSPEDLMYLKEKNIDIIISSNGQIFKKALLNLPNIACINRHTALLPKNGGVLPVFWAMIYNEKKFGVSVHFMVEKIDEGKVIAQKVIKFQQKDSLFANYVYGFNESVEVTIKALKLLQKGAVKNKKKKQLVGYNTFPTDKDFKLFRKEHKAFYLKDIPLYMKIIT